MKNKFKPIIAALMSFCMLGTMTACGDSDNDDEQKVYGENHDRNTDIRRADSAAKCIQNSEASALDEMNEEGRMESITKSDKPVILCSDKSKDINASGVDDKFYDLIGDTFSKSNVMEWFIVIKNGCCELAFVKSNECEFIGRNISYEQTDDGNFIYEYDGISFDEVYKQVVSENT